MKLFGNSRTLMYVLVIPVLVGVFLLEAYTHTLDTVAYIPVILLILWLAPNTRQIILTGVFGTLYLVAGFILSPEQYLTWAPVINRLIAIAIVWVAAVFMIKYRKSLANEERQRLQLKAVFNNATEAIFIFDLQGTILLANPWAQKMFGYTREELEGQDTVLLVPFHYRVKHLTKRESFLQKLNTRGQVPMGSGNEFLCRKKDGTIFPVDVSIGYSTIEDKLFIVAFVLDITENRRSVKKIKQLNGNLEKRVISRTRELRDALNLVERTNMNLSSEIQERNRIEARLYSSQARHNAMAHYFPRGWISVLDKELRYLLLDGEELEVLEWHQEDMIGRKMTDFISTTQRPEIDQALTLALQGHKTTFDLPGKSKTYRVFAVPLPDSNQQITEILIVGRDITERLQYEEGLRKSLDRERELSELKSRFVTMASHEFRTPLTNIASSAFLLENYQGSELEKNKNTHLTRIKRSVKVLTEILNDFLSVGRIDEGKVQPNLIETSITEFVQDILKELDSLKQHNQSVQFIHAGGDLIRTDRGMLRNIIANLMSNALKYTHANDKVEIITHIADDHLTITVRDHGMGISEEDKKMIFDRFYRAKGVAHIQGTGLGLSIVQRFAILLGGTVTFESKLNEGSSFIVTLPTQIEETAKMERL